MPCNSLLDIILAQKIRFKSFLYLALVYEILFFTNFNLQRSAFWDIIILLTTFPYYH